MNTPEAEAQRWLAYARSDLDALRNLLPQGWQVKVEYPDLASLSVWAVEARYPGDLPDVVEADAQAAFQLARGVWEAVCADLKGRGLAVD
jgi:hypothetical protein